MSGIFGSTTIKGTRITDFAQTSADVGSTIPFLYGRAPVKGNVIFAALPPKENRQVKRQGKGGVKQETFTYTTSYAIAFCRGPIQGYWWIKRNGKVVYSQDPAAPIEDKDYAAKWAAKVMMYNGTSSQMPSSMIEAIKGTGRVSAFRYLAYIAVPDEDVTDGGGAIPSYEAVPIASPSEVWLTSKPYAQLIEQPVDVAVRVPFILIEELLKDADAATDRERVDTRLTGGALAEALGVTLSDDEVVSIALTGGELKEPPVGNAEDCEVDITTLSGGALTAVPTGYLKDDLEVNSIALTGGELTATAVDRWYDGIVSGSANAIVFDLNDLGSLYLDTAGTTHATGVGDTIKAIRNKGTSGGFATSATGAVLQYDSEHDRNYIVPPATNAFTFTGAAAFLGEIDISVIAIADLVGNTSNYECLFQFGSVADGSYKMLLMSQVVGQGFMFYTLGGGGGVPYHSSLSYRSGAQTFIGSRKTTSPAGPSYSSMSLYESGTLIASSDYIAKSGTATNILVLGDFHPTVGVPAPVGKFYGMVAVDRVITSTERSAAVAGGLG